jgi:hypothetical protein
VSVQLTLTLPEHIYQRAQRLAELTGREVPEIIADALGSLLPLVPQIATSTPVEALSDEAVLALTDLQMEGPYEDRLSTLLEQQQAGDLNELEQLELDALMRVYDIGTLRKAQALAEAVKRGLREPLAL